MRWSTGHCLEVAGQGAPGLEREIARGPPWLHHLKFAVHEVKRREDRLPALLKGEGDRVMGLAHASKRGKTTTISAFPGRGHDILLL